MQVNVLEAKTQLSRLIERAEAGEEVVIARAGRPAVRLLPIRDPAVVATTPAHVHALLCAEGLVARAAAAVPVRYPNRPSATVDAALEDLRVGREER